jgi:hypothetical protein
LQEARAIVPFLGGILSGEKGGALVELVSGIPSCSDNPTTVGVGSLGWIVPQRGDFAFCGANSFPDELVIGRLQYSRPKLLSCPR